ncbi:MAG: hypothetical protein K6E32_04475 [Lachnospiraceae bacterium]|nr:hypothetical protein [Lachnospiraceae bacterium]
MMRRFNFREAKENKVIDRIAESFSAFFTDRVNCGRKDSFSFAGYNCFR